MELAVQFWSWVGLAAMLQEGQLASAPLGSQAALLRRNAGSRAPHGGELADGQEQPVGQPAVDGRHVGVLPQPDVRRLRPVHHGMAQGVGHQVP